jgi:hypothetical protein
MLGTAARRRAWAVARESAHMLPATRVLTHRLPPYPRFPPAEGGALYALGLIHTSHGADVRQLLLDSLRASQNEVRRRRVLNDCWLGVCPAQQTVCSSNVCPAAPPLAPVLGYGRSHLIGCSPSEGPSSPPPSPPHHHRTHAHTLQVIQHGACLGLGIAALGTEDEEAFEDVKNVLYMDNAGGWRACQPGPATPAMYLAHAGWHQDSCGVMPCCRAQGGHTARPSTDGRPQHSLRTSLAGPMCRIDLLVCVLPCCSGGRGGGAVTGPAVCGQRHRQGGGTAGVRA